ncbi:MAG TPA: DUF2933 domain-containing protein [Candidatus Nanopelagicaceae bacterium]|jgi:hypothetical protein
MKDEKDFRLIVGVIVVAAVVLLSGASPVLLLLLACPVMMIFMMRSMDHASMGDKKVDENIEPKFNRGNTR